MTVQWKEPPARSNHRSSSGKIDSVCAELRKRPGDWALVAEGVAPSAKYVWEKRGAEATCRKSPVNPGKFDLYARWPVES